MRSVRELPGGKLREDGDAVVPDRDCGVSLENSQHALVVAQTAAVSNGPATIDSKDQPGKLSKSCPAGVGVSA
jgi:hypothetical protein